MFQKIRSFIEKFYPSEPISFSFSRFKIFFIIIIGLIVAIFFYLRSYNEDELHLLKQKHKEIKTSVQDYLNSMSHANYDDSKLSEVRNRLSSYKKELSNIEEKINSIRKFWFLE